MIPAFLALLGLSGSPMKVVDLDRICSDAFAVAQTQFPQEKLLPEDVGICVYALNREEKSFVRGGFRPDEEIYPASVVKVFYLGYAAHLLDEEKLQMSPELQRAARDMIVDSVNDATGYMVDLICGTTPGPELPAEELEKFGEKRRAVNRWYQSLGYEHVNAVQRTYNEGPYGRERQWVGENYDNRNMLSPDACCRFFKDVAFGNNWSSERLDWMKSFLKRANAQDEPEKADPESKEFIGRVIPSGTQLYSKAGLTSTTRHDSGWLVMPDGKEYAITIFTKRGNNEILVSFIAARILRGLGYSVPVPNP